MPPSSLIQNLNSDYIGAFKGLSPKDSPNRVLVYVEGNEDISFWRGILHDYESATLQFQIETPTRKGKQKAIEKSAEILSLAANAGPSLIICVDSDYDYLLQNQTPQSTEINTNRFIFQSYSYSTENLLCYHESLHILCVQATKNDNRVVDFAAFLHEYSRIIAPLFLWNVYFRAIHDYKSFTLTMFCKIVRFEADISIPDFRAELITLKQRVNSSITQLEIEFPEGVNQIFEIHERLRLLGFNEDYAYLFIQGHTLMDNVVLRLLNPLERFLVREKESQIREKAKNSEHLANEMKHYSNQKQSIDTVLRNNTEYKKCFLYHKIKADLDNVFS